MPGLTHPTISTQHCHHSIIFSIMKMKSKNEVKPRSNKEPNRNTQSVEDWTLPKQNARFQPIYNFFNHFIFHLHHKQTSTVEQGDHTNVHILWKKHKSTDQFLFSSLTSKDTEPTIKEYLIKEKLRTTAFNKQKYPTVYGVSKHDLQLWCIKQNLAWMAPFWQVLLVPTKCYLNTNIHKS